MKRQNNGSQTVSVDVSKCRDIWLSFSYTGNGWNPYSAILHEYIHHPSLTYEQSTYKTYLEKCQLRTIQELVFVGNNQPPLPPMDKGWTPYPWFSGKKPMQMRNHFGPLAPVRSGPAEFKRTIDIYKRLKQEGYQPDRYPDGYIRGYFLVNGSDYRFHILGGNHRMAALGTLGYRSILVKIQPVSGQAYVDVSKVDEWPNVRNGLYDRTLAVRVFKTIFAKNGKERAKQLGVYSKIF